MNSKKAFLPYGCVQMAGNVFEWVSDWFDGFYYQTGPAENPRGLEKPTFEVAMARVPVFAVPGGGTLSMGEVKRGERYEILLRDEDSYKILFGNTEGWLPRRAGVRLDGESRPGLRVGLHRRQLALFGQRGF